MATSEILTYKDFNLTNMQNVLTKDCSAILGNNAIKKSISNLISTQKATIPFNRQKGLQINLTLFSFNDLKASNLFDISSKNLFELFEPRIKIDKTEIVQEFNKFSSSIYYTINDIFQENVKVPISFT